MLDFLSSLNWTAILVTGMICGGCSYTARNLLRTYRVRRDIERIRYQQMMLVRVRPKKEPTVSLIWEERNGHKHGRIQNG